MYFKERKKLKNYGLFSLLSILGFVGLRDGTDLFLLFFVFLIFIPFFWVQPRAGFVFRIKEAGNKSFIANLIVTSISTIFLYFKQPTNESLIVGSILGFSVSIIIFCGNVLIFEWKNRKSTGK